MKAGTAFEPTTLLRGLVAADGGGRYQSTERALAHDDTSHAADAMDHLKLIAFDTEDLDVVSAHLQDSALTVADMAFLPREQRFVALVHRFDWPRVLTEPGGSLQRSQTVLRIDRVRRAQYSGFDLAAPQSALALLTVRFSATAPDDPAGVVTLCFSGGGAIRLDVECIEAELKDLGPTWRTLKQPVHPEEDAKR